MFYSNASDNTHNPDDYIDTLNSLSGGYTARWRWVSGTGRRCRVRGLERSNPRYRPIPDPVITGGVFVSGLRHTQPVRVSVVGS